MGLLVGVGGLAVVVCFVLVALGAPFAGWLTVLVVMGWTVLSLTRAAASLAADSVGGAPPTLWVIFRTWIVTAARMAWFPCAVIIDAVRGRVGRRQSV